LAIIAAFGLLAIGLKPVIEATPAFAQIEVQKIAICDQRGYPCINSLGIAKLNK